MTDAVVSLADMKSFLHMSSDTSNDAELQDFIDAAVRLWVNRCGPVLGAPAFDEWYSGGSSTISLRQTPVLNVSSVTESFGSSIVYTLTEQIVDDLVSPDAWGYSIDTSRGLLTRRVMGLAARFADGINNIHVIYTAGYTQAPADVVLAVKLLVMHMWTTQRGSAKRPGMGGDDVAINSPAFTWPNRVEEIAANYYIPGIA